MRVPPSLRYSLLALLCVLGFACDPSLQKLAIKADPSSAAQGTKVQLTATATYSDGSSADVTSLVTWTSADPNIAAVSNNSGQKGQVTAMSKGTVVLTGAYKDQSVTTSFTVTAATLQRVDVSPAFAAIATGVDQRFTATGVFSDATSQDLTSSAQWTVSDAALATLKGTGTQALSVTGAAHGQVIVTATVMGVSGSARLTVTDASLTSIAVTPATATVAKGTTLKFTATGTFSDGASRDLSSVVTWTSADDTRATITSGSYGVATALAMGDVTVTATLNGVSGSATLKVSDAQLSSLTVTPPVQTLAKGTTAQLQVTGTFSDGSTQDLTHNVTWTSTQGSVASVQPTGVVSAVSQGAATITATMNGRSASAALTVSDAVLTSLAVAADNASVAKGVVAHLSATGTFSDGSTQALTSLVVWSSSDATVATVSNMAGMRGTVTTLARGMATLSAALGDKSSSLPFTVSDASLSSITLSGDTQMAKGTYVVITATGHFSDGSTADVGAQATWSSSDRNIADAYYTNGRGVQVDGRARGTAQITATLGGVTSTVPFTVTDAVLTQIDVHYPFTPALFVGNSRPFTAVGTYSDGSTQDVTSLVTWNSDDPLRLSVSNSSGSRGVATALAGGPAGLWANLGAVASARVTVHNRQLSFDAPMIATTGTQQSDVYTTDWDGDQRADLFVVESDNHRVQWFINDGMGGLPPMSGAIPLMGMVKPLALRFSDLDKDGHMDMVMTTDANVAYVFYGMGTGYGVIATIPADLSGGVAVGDFDQDGMVDIAGVSGSNLSYIRGQSNRTFAAPAPITLPTPAHSLRTADLDQDGILDLLVADTGTNDIYMMQGDAMGGFWPKPIAANSPTLDVTPADINQDGLPDLVVNSSQYGIGVALANQDHSYGPVRYSYVPASRVDVADVNGDGLPDVLALLSAPLSGVGVLQGRGDGSFVMVTDPTRMPVAVVAADVNGDQLNDVCAITASDLYCAVNQSM